MIRIIFGFFFCWGDQNFIMEIPVLEIVIFL